jgi:hypothetical protein
MFSMNKSNDKKTDRSRYFNPSKNYWFSFNAFLISLIGLYFRCLSFRVVLVNTARSGVFVDSYMDSPTISALFVYKQERSNHMLSMNESNDEKKSSIRTGSINVYLQCVGIFYYRSRDNHS